MNQEDQANQVRYFIYLDGLRESGKTNMFGAVPYLMFASGVTNRQMSGVCSQK